MKFNLVLPVFALFLVFNSPIAHGTLTSEAIKVKNALSSGQQCAGTWGVDSSKAGQDTKIFGVREFNDGIQYQVYHSAERPRIWTWDFRIINIKCS